MSFINEVGFSLNSSVYSGDPNFQIFLSGLRKWQTEGDECERSGRELAVSRMCQCYLTNSENLDLESLSLSSLPAEFGQLVRLKKLNLSGNQLKEFSPEIGQLINLEELFVLGNQIKTIPREIGNLTYLKILDLSDNLIEELPPEIGQLQHLLLLSLHTNQLQRIPGEIGLLINLQSLSLSRNQIKRLPFQIGGLKSLRELWLGENFLTGLPPEIAELKNLRTLHLADNPLDEFRFPPQILCFEDLQIFFEELLFDDEIHAHTNTFEMCFQDPEQCPVYLLTILYELLQRYHSFPRIIYQDSEGIDAGGLSRDFVARLFKRIFDKKNPCSPVAEFEGFLLPRVEPNPASPEGVEIPNESKFLYQTIGMIFGAALSKADAYSFAIGPYFHSVVFEMLSALSLEDLKALPEYFHTLDDFSAHQHVLKKLLSCYLASRMTQNEQTKETASQVAAFFIDNYFSSQNLHELVTDPHEIFSSAEEVLNMFPNADQIVLGVLSIAQGLYQFRGDWVLDANSPINLQLKIEGYFSKEDVVRALSWQEGENSQANEQIKKFLIRWVTDENTSLKTLSEFLFALTGSYTLIKDKNLQVQFLSADDSNGGILWYPRYYTCNFLMEIPRNYPDYETFKAKLEESIVMAIEGFQAK